MPAGTEESLPFADIDDARRSGARWRWLLTLAVLLVTALIWGTWLEITTHEKRQALTAAARRQANLAIALGHYLTRLLSNADAVGQFLADVHASPALDVPAHLAGRARANDLFTEMTICSADATFHTSRSDADAAERCSRWLQEAPANARTYPAQPVVLSGQTLVPFLTRVPPAGTRQAGVIALLVDVRRLLGLLQDYSIPDDTVVLVAGLDGRPRARWHNVRHMADQRAPEAALLPAVLAAGTPGQIHRVEGRAILATARRMQAWPLTIFVGTAEADTLADSDLRSAYYAWAGAIATVLTAAFAWVLLRQQARVLRTSESLARARQRLHALNLQLEDQVRARTSELQAACRDLETFSYSVAHDVRAPIAAIRGFADALAPRVEAMGDAKSAHYLRRIVANATQMGEITEALLSLGKLSRPSFEPAPIDLSAMAHEVLGGLREREPHRVVEAAVQEGLVVQGDRVLVRQVLENLLGNAWKFTGRRSPAVIALEGTGEDNGWTTIAIRDNGEGFDMARAPDLFQPFRRAHASGEFAGTGVGLAAVERIVRLHGGRTWIASSPQHGTSVFFTLRAKSGAAV